MSLFYESLINSTNLANKNIYHWYLIELYFRSLIHDIEKIAEVDGYAAWREKESNDLSALVQERFRHLQNPKICDKARKLVCGLNKVDNILREI